MMSGEMLSMNRKITGDIRRSAKELFDAGKIDILVGYRKGSAGYRARPAFIASAAEAGELVWDATCSNNIAVYLPQLFQKPPRRAGPGTPVPGGGAAKSGPRVGFVVKGCDLRSLIALVKENQAPRENLVLIGVPCRGMIDERKLDAAVSGAEVVSIDDGGDTATAALSDGRSLSFPRESLVQDACTACRNPMPEGVDFLVAGAGREPGDGGEGLVSGFRKLADTERWRRFSGEISRCIRCYACRQACPTCYCTECFADLNSPAWIGASNELTDTMIFHLIRIFHQAGRCVECDACLRACPMHIDLRTFTKKIAADVRELFGFTPDFDPKTPPPLCTYKEDDRQGFITEPGKGLPPKG